MCRNIKMPPIEEKLYSHANEELIIRDFFGDRKGGLFST